MLLAVVLGRIPFVERAANEAGELTSSWSMSELPPDDSTFWQRLSPGQQIDSYFAKAPG